MKLSTKGRYGLRAMLDIALYCEEEAVSLRQIAQRQDISINYLEQLIAKLKKAGLVNSIRGAQGGYIIAKSPNEISVGDILRALEGNLNLVDCVELTDSGDTCRTSDLCVIKYVWKRITDSINYVVDELMLSELIEESKELQKKNGKNTNEEEEPVNNLKC